jgi:hypothetical protein
MLLPGGVTSYSDLYAYSVQQSNKSNTVYIFFKKVPVIEFIEMNIYKYQYDQSPHSITNPLLARINPVPRCSLSQPSHPPDDLLVSVSI